MATEQLPSIVQADFRGGCNTSDMPYRIPEDSYQWGENLVNRGGLLQTRMGFDAIMAELPEGNAQGHICFRPTGSSDTLLVAAVDGKIYITKEINSTWQAWFQLPSIQFYPNALFIYWCVATKSVQRNPDGSLVRIPSSRILIMQDGGWTRPAMYDGSVSRHLFPDPARRETPLGGPMAWIGDRLWVGADQELIASDIGDPISFYEYVTISGGGSFSLPDTITAMAPNTDLKNLLVWTANSTHNVQAGIRDRTTWVTTPDFINDIIPGIGCLSHRSVANQYGLLWWWSNMGFINFNAAYQTYRDSTFNFQDRSMARSKGNLSPILNGIASARFENYIMTSVPSGDVWNKHTWVMDQAVGYSTQGEDASRWNGIWTGIRPIEWTTGIFNGIERIFVLSRDFNAYEGTRNRVWEAFREREDSGNRISWQAESRMHSCPGGRGKIKYVEVVLAEMKDEVRMRIYWRGTRGEYKLFSDQTFNATPGPFNTVTYPTFGSGDLIEGTRKQGRYVVSHQVDDTDPDDVTGFVESKDNDNEDRAFSILFKFDGQAAIVAYRLFILPTNEVPHGKPTEDESYPLPERFVTQSGESVFDQDELPAYLVRSNPCLRTPQS